jgi:hypothetical protein
MVVVAVEIAGRGGGTDRWPRLERLVVGVAVKIEGRGGRLVEADS